MFLDIIPKDLEEGKIYISKKYETAVHLCACGCKEKAVTPLGEGAWTLTENDCKITLRPSIGNWIWQKPDYHAHYFITDNKVNFV